MEPSRLSAISRLSAVCLSAAIIAVVLFWVLRFTPLTMLVPLAALPLGYVGFRLGMAAMVYSSALALLLIGVGIGGNFLLVFLVWACLPHLLLIQRSLQHDIAPDPQQQAEPVFSDIGNIVASAVLLAAMMLTLLHLIFVTTPDGGLLAQLEILTRQGLAIPEAHTFFERILPADQLKDPAFPRQLARSVLLGFPALVVWIWLVALKLAHSLAKASGYVLRDNFDYRQWQLPHWMDGLFALALIVFLVAEEPLRSYSGGLAVLCAAAYVLLGLSCVHIALHKKSWHKPLIWGICLFAFILTWPLAILGLLGILARPLHLQKQCDKWSKR